MINRLLTFILLATFIVPVGFFGFNMTMETIDRVLYDNVREEYIDKSPQNQKLPKHLSKNVVLIINLPGRGSGVILQPGVVLTAEHVTPQLNKHVLVMHAGKSPEIYKVVLTDRKNDLALLVKPGTKLDKGILDTIGINSPGQAALAMGYGAHSALMGVYSYEMGPDLIMGDLNSDTYSRPFIGGMSGGPIYNARGEIVGIVSRGYNVHFWLSQSEQRRAHKALRDFKNGQHVNADDLLYGMILAAPSLSPNEEMIKRFLSEAIKKAGKNGR